jgi:hypothetical protein
MNRIPRVTVIYFVVVAVHCDIIMSEYLRRWFTPAAPAPSASERAGQQQQQTLRLLQQRRQRCQAIEQQISQLEQRARHTYQDQSKPQAQRTQEATRLLQEKAKLQQELNNLKRSMAPLEMQQAGIVSTLDTVQTMQLLRDGTAVQNDLVAEVGGAHEAQRTFVAAERALKQTASLSDQLALGFGADTEAAIYGVSGAETEEAIARELEQYDSEALEALIAEGPLVFPVPIVDSVPASSNTNSPLLSQLLNTKM